MYTDNMNNRKNAHEALLGATGELTYARGITATGVDAIAARAGVTKRTLYQHFGSKDALVAEALSSRSARSWPALEANARRRSEETGEPVVLALFDVIENALRTSAKAGCAFINASLEINRANHPVREAALAHLRARSNSFTGSSRRRVWKTRIWPGRWRCLSMARMRSVGLVEIRLRRAVRKPQRLDCWPAGSIPDGDERCCG